MINRILVWGLNIGAVCLAVLGGWLVYDIVSDDSEPVLVAVGDATASASAISATGTRLSPGEARSAISILAVPTLPPSQFQPVTPTPVPTATAVPTVVPTEEPVEPEIQEVVQITPTPDAVRVPTPEPTAAATPTTEVPTPTPEVVVETATPTPTATPTAEAQEQPTATATPSATPGWTEGTAVVGTFWIGANDGVTVRDAPGGDAIETVGHGSQVSTTGRGAVTTRDWVEIAAPLQGWVAAEFLSVTQPAPLDQSPGPVSGTGPDPAQMAQLRECESGGNYAINSGNGFYGAYQFSIPTWDDIASRYFPALVSVLPSDASPADQDSMMIALYSERGYAPWPGCRAKLGLP